MTSRVMTKQDIIDDEKSAPLYPCIKCGYNRYIVKLNISIDIVHLECGVCGAKAAVFKVGEK